MNSFLINSTIVLVLGLVLSITLLILTLITYYMVSTGLYKLSKDNKLSNAWFSYIPILQVYIAVKNVENINFFGFKIPNLEIVLPILAFLSGLKFFEVGSLSASYSIIQLQMSKLLGDFYSITVWVGKISFIITSILMFMVIYKIYRKYGKPNNFKKMIIISIITLGMAIPFYIYNIGNDQYIVNEEKRNNNIASRLFVFTSIISVIIGCIFFVSYLRIQPKLKQIQETQEKLARAITGELDNQEDKKDKKEKYIDVLTSANLVVENDIPVKIYPSSEKLEGDYYTIKENKKRNYQGISFKFSVGYSRLRQQYLKLSYILKNVSNVKRESINFDLKFYDKNDVLISEIIDGKLSMYGISPGEKINQTMLIPFPSNLEIKEIYLVIHS